MAEKQRKNSDGKAKRLANLKPFQPGQSGNPDGRPEGTKNRATILRRLLETETDFTNPLTLQKERATVEERMMFALIAKACRGDIQAIKEVQDTLYGKVTDKQELSGSVEVKALSLDDIKKIAAGRREQVEALDDE